jgi:hypothetical protein
VRNKHSRVPQQSSVPTCGWVPYVIPQTPLIRQPIHVPDHPDDVLMPQPSSSSAAGGSSHPTLTQTPIPPITLSTPHSITHPTHQNHLQQLKQRNQLSSPMPTVSADPSMAACLPACPPARLPACLPCALHPLFEPANFHPSLCTSRLPSQAAAVATTVAPSSVVPRNI